MLHCYVRPWRRRLSSLASSPGHSQFFNVSATLKNWEEPGDEASVCPVRDVTAQHFSQSSLRYNCNAGPQMASFASAEVDLGPDCTPSSNASSDDEETHNSGFATNLDSETSTQSPLNELLGALQHTWLPAASENGRDKDIKTDDAGSNPVDIEKKGKKRKRLRATFTSYQVRELESAFEKNHYPNVFMMKDLAKRINEPVIRVQV